MSVTLNFKKIKKCISSALNPSMTMCEAQSAIHETLQQYTTNLIMHYIYLTLSLPLPCIHTHTHTILQPLTSPSIYPSLSPQNNNKTHINQPVKTSAANSRSNQVQHPGSCESVRVAQSRQKRNVLREVLNCERELQCQIWANETNLSTIQITIFNFINIYKYIL